MLEELEEALIVSGALRALAQRPRPQRWLTRVARTDFGPRTSLKIVDIIRERVRSGQLKSGADIRAGCVAAACRRCNFSPQA